MRSQSINHIWMWDSSINRITNMHRAFNDLWCPSHSSFHIFVVQQALRISWSPISIIITNGTWFFYSHFPRWILSMEMIEVRVCVLERRQQKSYFNCMNQTWWVLMCRTITNPPNETPMKPNRSISSRRQHSRWGSLGWIKWHHTTSFSKYSLCRFILSLS